MRNLLLFVGLPYAAAAALALGLAVRHALARRRMEQARAEAADAWRQVRGGWPGKVGWAAIVVGHGIGLFLPGTLLHWNGAPLRLYLLEGTGFLFGLLVLVGWARLMWRHAARSGRGRSVTAELAETAFLSLLFVAVVSGLLTAARYRWGSSWGGATLGSYLVSLVRGAPATALVERMPFLVKLHVVSLFALMAILPATRAALIAVVAMDRALAVAKKPFVVAARAARARVERVHLGRWIWPEEDLVDEEGESVAPGDAGDDLPADAGGIAYRDRSENPRAPN
jgi:nitrate reductase gamma subunit